MEHRIIAVIPAYNEKNTITSVVKNTLKYTDNIIVVNDCSTDDTSNLAKEAGAIVINNTKNKGYDKSINKGFEKAKEIGATIIITLDADGQHKTEDIPKLINPIKNGNYDVVVGIRPYKQRIAEHIYAKISKKRGNMLDPLCGLKAYSIKAYNATGYFDKLNSIGTELMFNSYKKGFKIKQIPITIEKREDNSRFGNKIKGNYKILKAIINITKNI
jgi:glycosyltransferase involved in cell wall biosynthesis